jgi:hypothetical protein
MLKIYVGWDPREDLAWEVCRYSLVTRAVKKPIEVIPLVQSDLRARGIYKRPVDNLASTEFSLTRFLTPSLAGERGFAVFVDCDFLFLEDINNVLNEIDPIKAVSVVKHEYLPKEGIKMDGCIQHTYPRKNWSSFMVFNCEHPSLKKLTPQLVNNVEPSFLHQFKWIDDAEIGNLSITWNYLEGWYPSSGIDLKAIHYTRGGPWFEHMKNCDFANEWITESKKMSANKIQSKTKANHANHY